MNKHRHKVIAIVVLFSFLLLFPSFATVRAIASVKAPQFDGTSYSDFLNNVTTYINDSVGNDVTLQGLNNKLENDDFAKAVAQRQFIKNAKPETIESFATTTKKAEFIEWILNDTEVMNLFLESGEPKTDYTKTFEVWFEIWDKDKDSHQGYELKLAIASAKIFGNGVPKWYTTRTLVSPYERYEYYKDGEKEGKFPISMKTRSIWDLKNTIAAPVSNWDLDYIRDVIHKNRYNENNQKLSVDYPPYTATSIYKDKNGKPYSVFNTPSEKFFGPNSTIKEVHEIGGVCGTASKFSTIANNAFGIPGFSVGQPGHAANVSHSPKAVGRWDLRYNVSGWGLSRFNKNTKTIPYTDYKKVIHNVGYLFVYETSREDEVSLRKSFQLKWIADAIEDFDTAQAVREIAMNVNKWNIDVWRDYIGAMLDITEKAYNTNVVPSDKMTISATSSNRNTPAKNAIDGNNKTIWHTQYNGKRSTLPQSITLNFDKAYNINKLSYLPRQNGSNGIITKYNLYVSENGTDYELIKQGSLAKNRNEKIIEFDTVNATSIKLEAIEGANNFATAAEMKVYQPFVDRPISDEQWEDTCYKVINNLNEHPVVVMDLLQSTKKWALGSNITREQSQKYIVEINSMLDKVSQENKKQQQICKFLKDKLVSLGFYLADFDFDGANAGKLMGSKTDSEYSLDGGATWKKVLENNVQLSEAEINSITAENDIRIRIVGAEDYVLIPITKAPSLPKLYANDDVNKLFGMNDKLYYSVDNGNTWIKFESYDKFPDLTGDITIQVKILKQGKTLGSETRTFEFKSKSDVPYILPSEIVSVTAISHSKYPITKVIDGNINSSWRTGSGNKPVIFEFAENTDVYKLEYMPNQASHTNGNVTQYKIYTSVDGKDYTLVSSGTWDRNNETKTATFNAPNTKFLKFEPLKSIRNFSSAAEIRIFKTSTNVPQVSFSLDGNNAGKLMGATTSMEYSFDNGDTWKDVTKLNMPITEDLESVTKDTVIKVRVKDTTDEVVIRFNENKDIPNVVVDDEENTLTGLDNTMEYSIDNGLKWTRYENSIPYNLNGNIDILVRRLATGTTVKSEPVKVIFTENEPSNFTQDVLYKMISKSSGRSLDVKGGTKQDALLIQYGYKGSSNQIAYLEDVGDNLYKIVIKRSGKVLTPKGSTVVQKTDEDLDIQKWKLVNLGNNEYFIINAETGNAITANGKWSVKISEPNYTKYQIWKINLVHEPKQAEVQEDVVAEIPEVEVKVDIVSEPEEVQNNVVTKPTEEQKDVVSETTEVEVKVDVVVETTDEQKEVATETAETEDVATETAETEDVATETTEEQKDVATETTEIQKDVAPETTEEQEDVVADLDEKN